MDFCADVTTFYRRYSSGLLTVFPRDSKGWSFDIQASIFLMVYVMEVLHTTAKCFLLVKIHVTQERECHYQEQQKHSLHQIQNMLHYSTTQCNEIYDVNVTYILQLAYLPNAPTFSWNQGLYFNYFISFSQFLQFVLILKHIL